MASAAAVLGSTPIARAIEPIARKGAPLLRLSCAAYSFRDDFVPPKGSPAGTRARIDMFDFLDYCADHRCEGAELTSYYFPKDAGPDYFAKVRRHAHLRGIGISGTAVGNVFTLPPGPKRDSEIASVKRWIDNAALLGAPHIRIFAGAAQPGQDRADAVRHCISATEEVCDYAGSRGIMLGLENHGGIVALAENLLEIVRAVKSPWLGINLDTGNFHSADPYADLERCVPYAVNVQFKAEIRRAGSKQNELSDLPRIVRLLRDGGYQGWFALEYEMKADPWKTIPGLLADLRQAVSA